MPDIIAVKSHPDKLLKDHLQGVRDNVRWLTDSALAELVAVWHDVGKCNPNFQTMLSGKESSGYTKHSYISAYTLYSNCLKSAQSKHLATDFPAIRESNDLLAAVIIIAKHHGDLPDMSPEGSNSILNIAEIDDMLTFLEKNEDAFKAAAHSVLSFEEDLNLQDVRIKAFFRERLGLNHKQNIRPLDYFISTQHAFASLVLSDKADAAGHDSFIDSSKKAVADFAPIYDRCLTAYLNGLKPTTPLNALRTGIRQDAVEHIQKGLQTEQHIFELTAPTGSGKTLMLLSLANQIIQVKGPKRIIYALPFLSITEQVEAEILKIFSGYEPYIQRIDSKSENAQFGKVIEELEINPTQDKYAEMNLLDFQEKTFDYPLVITTFVRFFETLLSNVNAELLKLPNFSNCVFLLDEIQTLPPRLYGFFIAYLTRFCEMTGSYAIVSTATQPYFELPTSNGESSVIDFFIDYQKPYPLLSLEYFNHTLFNRYHIQINQSSISLEELCAELTKEQRSCLVILNTIDDTKDLYRMLHSEDSEAELILLNTHFTPNDRKRKIAMAKDFLSKEQQVIVVSTQLVEAGVDIDFPVVYRDMTTVSSIVQSAGRCNRNGKMKQGGDVRLISLHQDGKERASLIYRGRDEELLRFTKQALTENEYTESALLSVQQRFFRDIQQQLCFGLYNCMGKERMFVKDMIECMYEKIGAFALIDKHSFGEEISYYVPTQEDDNSFEELLVKQDELVAAYQRNASIDEISLQKKKRDAHLRKMQNQIIQIRLKPKDSRPTTASERDYFGLFKISLQDYTFESGVNLTCSCLM